MPKVSKNEFLDCMLTTEKSEMLVTPKDRVHDPVSADLQWASRNVHHMGATRRRSNGPKY